VTTPGEGLHGQGVSSAEPVAAERNGSERSAPEQIQADIEQTRQELGETVEALTTKLDVKARAGQRLGAAKEQARQKADVARRKSAEMVTRTKEAATEDKGWPRPAVPIAAGIVVVTVAAVVWRRRHHG